MSIELSNAESFIAWIKMKADLNRVAVQAGTRFVKRGDVYWCHFGLNVGSEMSKATPRPAVIVQNYIANVKSSNTIVVPVTHDTASLPCLVPIVPIQDERGNVVLNGQVNTSNIICISKARLGDLICRLSMPQMKKIDESIAKSVDLMRYYKEIEDKYKSLNTYCSRIKEERNKAQDTIQKIRTYLEHITIDGQSQEVLEEISKILDT